MDYIDYEDILRRKRALSDLLSSGTFDPKNASTEDIRWAQRLIGTKDDGLWGTQSRKAMDSYRPYDDDYLKRSLGNGDFDPKTASTNDIKAAQSIIGTKADGVWGDKSQAALDTYRKSYDGPVKFRWNGMEGNEAAQAYSAWDTSRIEAEERIAANEKRIEELKQEYLILQQEQETDTEDLERNLAANRAGIGDMSQYNAWRARVDAREASKQAREADSYATLAQLRSQVDRAAMDVGIARGTRETDIAQSIYREKLAAYNAAARKMGQPELSENELATKKYITEADVIRYRLKHRDSKGVWDSPENQQKYYEMAGELGLEGAKLQEEAAYQSNKPSEDAKRKKWAERKAKADKLVRDLVNMRMNDTQRRLFNNRWNAGTDEDIKLIKEFYNYDTKTGAFSPKG